MKLKLNNILAYSHQGKRDYQEDSFGFGDFFLIVSDGVGGLAKGNIASKIVVDHFKEAYQSGLFRGEDIEVEVKTVVDSCLLALLDYANQYPESYGMGATLAMVIQVQDTFYSIHIGDSRVYLLDSQGDIKWRSTDHSLVQELFTAGIITEEELTTHPRRNVITRVLQAKEEHSTSAAITELKQVEEGDVFLVCSDGVTESWSDKALQISASHHKLLQDFMDDVALYASVHSSDNNTAVFSDVASIDRNSETKAISENNEKETLSQIALLAEDVDAASDLDNESELPSQGSNDKQQMEVAHADPILDKKVQAQDQVNMGSNATPIERSSSGLAKKAVGNANKQSPSFSSIFRRFLPFFFIIAVCLIYFLWSNLSCNKQKESKSQNSYRQQDNAKKIQE
jgi:serine/threonine protein phosphatase PrpC